jgi:hypothetical protein
VNWSQQVEAELFIGGKADKVVFFLFFYRWPRKAGFPYGTMFNSRYFF